MLRGSLPGGAGDDLHAALQDVDVLFQHDVSPASAEQIAEQALEVAADRLQRLGEQPPTVGVDPFDNPFQRVLRADQVLVLPGQRAVTLFEPLQLLQRLDVHVAEVVDLAAQVVDLLLDLFPLVLLLGRRLVLQFGQLDTVVLAQAIGHRRSLVADFARLELFGV